MEMLEGFDLLSTVVLSVTALMAAGYRTVASIGGRYRRNV